MSVTNLVLIGRTGNGKSATGNTILGRPRFTSQMSPKSVTKQCEYANRKLTDGRIIRVIDTPGLFDTDAKRGIIEREIVRCIDIAKDGVHGFILVLSIKNRFTEEEANAFEKVQVLFGPKILDYMTIVFTHADQLNDYRCFNLDDYLKNASSNLKNLLRKLNRRVVEFDNITKNEGRKECQVSKLIEVVDQNVEDNGGDPYTNELFELAQKMTSQVYYIQEKEESFKQQIDHLHKMMNKNTEEMKEKMLAEIKRIQEESKCAANTVIRELVDQLAEHRKTLKQIKEIEDSKGCTCSIM